MTKRIDWASKIALAAALAARPDMMVEELLSRGRPARKQKLGEIIAKLLDPSTDFVTANKLFDELENRDRLV